MEAVIFSVQLGLGGQLCSVYKDGIAPEESKPMVSYLIPGHSDLLILFAQLF